MSNNFHLAAKFLCHFIISISLVACGGGGDDGGSGGGSSGSGGGGAIVKVTAVTCTTTGNDSVDNSPATWTRIRSETNDSPLYYLVTLSRQTQGSGPAITMDYMVHEPTGTAQALIVLIAGGPLNANIQGVGNGTTPTNAGGNFLVRSAHLFAAQGFRVLTIDRPSDFDDYLMGGFSSNFDTYRTSMEHAVDLSELINIVNASENLPVVIAGTSRGSISAVAQSGLAAAIAVSAPLTSGAGTPLGTGNALASNVSGPAHVAWHALDGCFVTTPASAESLVDDFSDGMGVAISGGFINPGSEACDGDHLHGFPGIESCSVMQTTDWLTDKLASLSSTRPVTTAQAGTTSVDTPTNIDISSAATASVGGALTYSLPHTSTSLDGTISISGNNITYTPPTGVSGIVDTFVYIVSETGGGVAHQVVSVTIS